MAANCVVEKDPEILLLSRDVSNLPHIFSRTFTYFPKFGWTLQEIFDGSIPLVLVSRKGDMRETSWNKQKTFFDAVLAVGTGLEVSKRSKMLYR
jgi:hypothetical protein